MQSARSTIADEATLGQKASIRSESCESKSLFFSSYFQGTLVVTLIMTACFLGRSIMYIVQVHHGFCKH